MLMDCAPFNRDTVIAVEAFLSDLQKPICFVGKFRTLLNPEWNESTSIVEFLVFWSNSISIYSTMNFFAAWIYTLSFWTADVRTFSMHVNGENPSISLHLAHNGNRFDFPILLAEIQTALSVPSFYANADHGEQCVDDVPSLISTNADSDDDHSSTVSKAKDCATQTIIALEDYDRTSLTSIACADSLVFFRKQYQSLREKETTSQPNPNSLSSSSAKPSADANDENLKINASVCVSPPSEPVCMPVKYVPSTDPARQQPSMKLVKIYEREFAQSTLHLNAHRAEDDCLMLLAILKRHLAEWLEWMEHNHQPLGHFSSLQSNSTPGKSPAKNVPVNLWSTLV